MKSFRRFLRTLIYVRNSLHLWIKLCSVVSSEHSPDVAEVGLMFRFISPDPSNEMPFSISKAPKPRSLRSVQAVTCLHETRSDVLFSAPIFRLGRKIHAPTIWKESTKPFQSEGSWS